MGLDEALFARLHRWWSRRRHSAQAATELSLAATASRRSHLLALLCGNELRLVFGDGSSRLSDRVVMPATLPIVGSVADTEAVATLRLALAAAAEATATTAPRATSANVAVERMQTALPDLLQWLDREWPTARNLLDSAERYAAGLAPPGSADADTARFLLTHGTLPIAAPGSATADLPTEAPASRDAMPTGTEREKPRTHDVDIVTVEEPDDGTNPIAHVFEKVKTAEEHTGGQRELDGSDELEDHLEALESLDLRQVVRSRLTTSSLFCADIDLAAGMVELQTSEPAGTVAIPYDEWDDRARRYLPAWCSVSEARGELAAADATQAAMAAIRVDHHSTIRTLRAEFARLMRGSTLRRRQPMGSDLDLDAIVDRHGDRHAADNGGRSTADERIYLARRPAAREIVAMVLIDHSLSSDSWVAGHRVLDVTREAVAILGEVLASVRLPVAMAAFCSHTRKDCRFDLIKQFDEGWPIAQRRLFGLRPDGYTRIGPALRHATTLLAQQHARRRLLLVISDSKPVDYDHYEGARGIGDIRQAVREARRQGIETLALTIDSRAGEHLPRMFGRRGFRIVPNTAALARAMARLHEQLMRRA